MQGRSSTLIIVGLVLIGSKFHAGTTTELVARRLSRLISLRLAQSRYETLLRSRKTFEGSGASAKGAILNKSN
jgi:hypothetical protein